MKKSIFFSLIFSCLLIAGALFFAPSQRVAAAVPNDDSGLQGYQGPDQGLVQCGRLGFGPKFCDMCDLIVLVKAALDFIWKSAWVIAAGMMIYGGFYMILPSFGAGGSGMFEKGKKILTNVAWGLVIVFFAWMMIDTIIKVVAGGVVGSAAPAGLFSGSQSFGPWNKIQCTRAPERAPLALLELPREFQCVNGQPVVVTTGFNPCDPLVAQNIQAWASGNGDSQVNVPIRGTCTNGILRSHNTDIPNLVQFWADNYGLDRALFQSFVIHESGGNPRATSQTGVVGLGQVTVETARRLEPSLTNVSADQVRQRMINEPSLSLRLSADLLRRLRDNPAIRGDTSLMAVAYNAGEGAIMRLNNASCQNQFAYQCPGFLSPGKSAEVNSMISGVNGNLNQIRSGSCNPS